MAAIVVAVGIGVFSRRGGLKEDTAIGILFAAALALGVVLMSTVDAPMRPTSPTSSSATCSA